MLSEYRGKLESEVGGKLDEASGKWGAALDVVLDRGWARPRAAVKLFAGELAATAVAGALAALALVAAADYVRLKLARERRRRKAMGHPTDPMYPLVSPPRSAAAAVSSSASGHGDGGAGWGAALSSLLPSFLGWTATDPGGTVDKATPHSPRPPELPHDQQEQNEARVSDTAASPSPRVVGGRVVQSEDGESGWSAGGAGTAGSGGSGKGNAAAAAVPDPYCPDKRREYLNWDQYFMALAFLSAKRSKDPYKQVGAVIVSPQRIIIGIGYNGFPRGCGDDALSWAKKSRDGDPLKTKHPYVCHAEANAILNKNASTCEGGTIYVTMFPCNECAKLIIQSGIRTVVYAQGRKAGDTLYDASKAMMHLAGVHYRRVCALDTPILIPAWPGEDYSHPH